jgi:hypothetical protein
MAVDPGAGDEATHCVAARLVAEIGAEELARAGFDGDGVLGRAYHDWAFGSLPPPAEVHTFWDAVFDCVDGEGFVERQAQLTGSPSADCVTDAVLGDDEVRLMFVYGVRPGATHEPMGPLNDWLRRYESFVAACAGTVTPAP